VRMELAFQSQCIKGRVFSIVHLVLLIEIKSGCDVLFEMQRDGHDAPEETHENYGGGGWGGVLVIDMDIRRHAL